MVLWYTDLCTTSSSLMTTSTWSLEHTFPGVGRPIFVLGSEVSFDSNPVVSGSALLTSEAMSVEAVSAQRCAASVPGLSASCDVLRARL